MEAKGPDVRAVSLAEAVEKARVHAPTRGNRRLESFLEAVNDDDRVRAWWYMAQINSERLRMSDHSWVHVQVVLNIAALEHIGKQVESLNMRFEPAG